MPGHKGVGLGTAMLDAARRFASERQARRMHLLVVEGNDAAIGFYEHRGWVRTGRAVDTMGFLEIPALIYELRWG